VPTVIALLARTFRSGRASAAIAASTAAVAMGLGSAIMPAALGAGHWDIVFVTITIVVYTLASGSAVALIQDLVMEGLRGREGDFFGHRALASAAYAAAGLLSVAISPYLVAGIALPDGITRRSRRSRPCGPAYPSSC
jgi:MFS family permease